MFQSLRRADGPADGDGDRPDEPDEQAESGGWAPADGYSTAYCDGSASDDEVDDSYWTGAWTETAAGDGAEATAGPQEPAPENQWPPPRHWPCPPAASGAPCAAEVSVLPGKGRSALAITKLSPGDEVGLERPFAFVVREEYAGSACANCCAACGKESSSTASFVFCTPTCENEAMRDTGAVYFQNLEKLGAIAKDCSVDVDLLRILLRLICTPSLQTASQEQRSGITGQRQYDPVTDGKLAAAHATLSLCTNWAALPGSWEEAVSSAAAALNQLLPAALQLPTEHLVALAAGVNSNAYGISNPSGGRTANVGFGHFPFAAMLNHSCDPNCAFSGTVGGAQTIRAIKQISPGEELCFSYIDPYQDVVARREELEQTKHFICECTRCIACTTDPDSGTSIVDRGISGVLCQRCVEQDGEFDAILRPQLMHDTAENNAMLANFIRGAATEKEISHPCCDTCGETTPTAWIQQVEQKAADAFSEVKMMYDKCGGGEETRRGLQLFLDLYRNKLLHRNHALCFQAHGLLANCCMASGEAPTAAVQLRLALRCALTVMNRMRSETASLFSQLGAALECVLDDDVARKKLPEKKAAQLKVECRKAYTQGRKYSLHATQHVLMYRGASERVLVAIETICSVVYGDAHTCTLLAAECVERLATAPAAAVSQAKVAQATRTQALQNDTPWAAKGHAVAEQLPGPNEYV